MSPVYRLPPGRSLFSRLLSTSVLVTALILAFFLGTVLFLVVLGAGLLLALVLYLRFWWLGRRLSKRPGPAPEGGVTLEGEYTVTKSAKAEDREGP